MAALTIMNFLSSLAVSFAASLMSGCDAQPEDLNKAKVTINDRTFTLDLALDNPTRIKGLSGVTEIAADGGLLFVFPDLKVHVQDFVMRECTIPIDIIYLDKSGRVTASHAMVPEEPRTAEEPKTADPLKDKYEMRLKRYTSKFAAQFVIELKGGTLETLKVKDGQQIKLDLAGLKKRAS